MSRVVSPHARLQEVRTLYDSGEPYTMAFAVGLWEDEYRILCRWNGEEDKPGFPQSRGHPVWMVLDHKPGLAAVVSLLDERDLDNLVYALGEGS